MIDRYGDNSPRQTLFYPNWRVSQVGIWYTVDIMKDAILNFSSQLTWQPVVEGGVIPSAEQFILCGMGGSALAGGLILACDSNLPLTLHRDYGLPFKSEIDRMGTLVIVCSFSGNTEETLDAYRSAKTANRPIIVVTSGGELLNRAQRDNVPRIIIPDATIQPRLAMGYFLKALALITGAEVIGQAIESVDGQLDSTATETEARAIAHRLTGRIPLIYSSGRYEAVGYFWKIMLNETAKIPAFTNVIPEQNHNELASFSGKPIIPFSIIALTSPDDHPRVARRFTLLGNILSPSGVTVETILLVGASSTERVIRSVFLASFVAFTLALARGVDPSAVPVIENLKRQLDGK